jgi:hypothetical protein
MVDASDEDGSSLSFNSGGAVASFRRRPSSWRPPLVLAMISPECPPPRVSLIVDFSLPWRLWGTRRRLWRMAACPRDWGCNYLTPKKEGREPTPERVGPVRTAQPSWALLGSFSDQFSPRSISCTLYHWPLQLWALDVITSATKLRDLYAWTSSLFISVLRSSHAITLVLATFGGKFSHLTHEFLQKRSPWLSCKTFSELVASSLI